MIELSKNKLYQWDVGVNVSVSEGINKVHFSNVRYGSSYAVDVVNGVAIIPPEVLQSGADVFCWAFVIDGNEKVTREEAVFGVVKRAKPSEYAYTETEIKTWEELKAEIEDINTDVVDINSTIDTINSAIENNTIIDITEERTIRDLKNGVYRVSAENAVYLYFDDNYEYACSSGIVVLENNGTDYNWISIGLDFLWLPNIMFGNSVVNETGILIANVTQLTDLLKTTDVLQVGNPTATYEPQQVYSANVINTQLAVPIMTDLTNLWQQKESIRNRVISIDSFSDDARYPTAKAVYDFGMNILAEVERMLENVNINASQLTAEAISTFTMTTSVEVEENA